MLKIHKNIVLDENQKPIAVQIPIEEFEQLEEVIENYGEEARSYYQSKNSLNCPKRYNLKPKR